MKGVVRWVNYLTLEIMFVGSGTWVLPLGVVSTLASLLKIYASNIGFSSLHVDLETYRHFPLIST